MNRFVSKIVWALSSAGLLGAGGLLLAMDRPAAPDTTGTDPFHSGPAPGPEADRRAALARLHAFEIAERARTDFATLPPFEEVSGENPIAVEGIGDDRFVALSDGSGASVITLSGDQSPEPVEASRFPDRHGEPNSWGWDERQQVDPEAPRDPQQPMWWVGGRVENKPLDRSQGFFGNIDSFLYLYRGAGDEWDVVDSLNLSNHGVITPKGLFLEADGHGLRGVATGYGGFRGLDWRWTPEAGFTYLKTFPLPPGIRDIDRVGGHWVGANPLLDCWVIWNDDGFRMIPAGRPPDPDDDETFLARLGEVLVFTELMGPENSSEGSRSRFTCETCHFDGYGDRRTHYTGRDSVFATTKPIRGLFNNRPHFSRALDPDLTTMVNAEFAVASAGSGIDPWFSLDLDAYPGLAEGLGRGGTVGPETLRRAVMTFLMRYTHAPKPARVGQQWPDHGARVFEQRCESCHAARLIATDPTSRVPATEWQSLVDSPAGPIVWAAARYEKTGITPYVHPEGARVPSLRRIVRKRPYFTNGSAATLTDVLERFRYDTAGATHGGTDAGTPLTDEERAALMEFLIRL